MQFFLLQDTAVSVWVQEEDMDESGVTPARPTWPGDMEKGKELSA